MQYWTISEIVYKGKWSFSIKLHWNTDPDLICTQNYLSLIVSNGTEEVLKLWVQ